MKSVCSSDFEGDFRTFEVSHLRELEYANSAIV